MLFRFRLVQHEALVARSAGHPDAASNVRHVRSRGNHGAVEQRTTDRARQGFPRRQRGLDLGSLDGLEVLAHGHLIRGRAAADPGPRPGPI